MISINNDYHNLPNEMLESIFKLLSPKELGSCASTCKIWQRVADQENLWVNFVPKKLRAGGVKSKDVFINRNKSWFFTVFPHVLITALGGYMKVKNLPYLNFSKPRVLENGMIQLSELNSPLTLGHVSTIPHSKKDKPFDSSDVNRYTFLAIRFINREFDPNCIEKDVNIWIIKNGESWTLTSGGNIGGYPTRVPNKDGFGNDFKRTIDYISRLVKGEPCGVHDTCPPIEHSKLTPLGTSTVILA